ncbi:ricin-type beta-trefoil lectin domain protein [uncultured Roseibium sp.]|uniref:ricin-type beta-trefoil lectin domain protein n=1 Tax=uncultured Roseibium sp. TaxID=1936171 RepID=UPI0026141B84|nr:ricin-type beta-trefoil lectin domain protein [uncultured Roseibium sp.]
MIRTFSIAATAVLTLATVHTATAAPPDLKTPAPVIYLADNLDENQNLGFCIDTVGRGLSDRLHAHSCKPQGGDVQFLFLADTGKIKSATFENLCAELLAPAAAGVTLGLLPCSDNPMQAFAYDPGKQEFQPQGTSDLCLASPGDTRSAGPFVSRDLALANCASTPPAQKQWVIRE